mmetsp:Transcript_44633/g.72701  ORF Transcript_44633/g.72701 Transcript_44633/m.72701 type:complete len:115 (+) Transcript_44633:870-1214(+)
MHIVACMEQCPEACRAWAKLGPGVCHMHAPLYPAAPLNSPMKCVKCSPTPGTQKVTPMLVSPSPLLTQPHSNPPAPLGDYARVLLYFWMHAIHLRGILDVWPAPNNVIFSVVPA